LDDLSSVVFGYLDHPRPAEDCRSAEVGYFLAPWVCSSIDVPLGAEIPPIRWAAACLYCNAQLVWIGYPEVYGFFTLTRLVKGYQPFDNIQK